MLALALTINGLLILWFFIFLANTHAGIFIGISATVWFFVFLKKKQDKLEEHFQIRFAGKNIRYMDKKVVFRAQESDGYSQGEGMGYLVLTDDELDFEMALLDKVLSIATSSITKVGETNRLLGVNPARTMLKIDFKDSNGKDDAIALNVKDLKRWIREISAAMNANK